jgi:hypothetical protein
MLIVLTILWVLIWALALVDLFRRDWSTPVKVIWALAMLVLPVVGVIAYLIVRPPSAADVAGAVGSRNEAPEERVRDRHPV